MVSLTKSYWLPFVGIILLCYLVLAVIMQDLSNIVVFVLVGVYTLSLLWSDRRITWFLMVFYAILFYVNFGTNLTLVIFPALLAVSISKSIMLRRIVPNLKALIPYFLFTFIILCWWIKTGTAPRAIYGGKFGIGNFSLYFNCVFNFAALSLPFFMKISIHDLKKALTAVMWVYIIELILVTISYISGFEFPFAYEIKQEASRGISRVGSIARLSYYVGIFTIYFGRKYFGKLTHFVVYFCLLLNLFSGGGRMELVMLCLAYFGYILWIDYSPFGRHYNFPILKWVLHGGAFIFFLITVYTYLPTGQAKRFGELRHPSESYQLSEHTLKSGTRASQWRYAVFESDWLAFGRGFSKHFMISYFGSQTVRQVSIGGAHNLYIAILYNFGYVALSLYFLHMIIFGVRFVQFYKSSRKDITAQFICIFLLLWYVPYAFFAGGIKAHYFLVYFLTGYVMNFSTSRIEKYEQNSILE